MLFLLFFAAAVAVLCPPPANASPDSLSRLQNEARQTRAEMERIEARLQKLEEEYTAARRELDAVNERLVQVRIRLKAAEGRLEKQRALLMDRLVLMYKAGDSTWLDVVLGSESFSDAQTAALMIRRIAFADKSAERELALAAREVRGLQEELQADRRDAVAAKNALDERRVALEGLYAERSAVLRNTVARIKKILSAPELLMKSGGKVTQVTWAQALLKSLGMPMTSENVVAIVSWEFAEGGHWYNTAHYNPLNTTQKMPGATVFNSVGVKAYTSWTQGLQATVITLRNGFYGGILSALRSGKSAEAVAAAVASSPWGTHGFSIRR